MKNRIDRCLKSMEAVRLDGLLVSFPLNITYLTGFKPVEAYLLISPKKIIYFTNFIYEREAQAVSTWTVHCVKENIFREVAVVAKKLGIQHMGFEAKKLSFLEYKMLNKEATSRDINFVKTIDIIEELREVKTDKEIQSIKTACAITQEAFIFAKEIVDERSSEKQLQIEVEKFLRIKGDNELAFSPVVAFGENSSLPHYIASSVTLDEKEVILIDMGAKYDRYCADLTRVFFLGKISAYSKKLFDIVKRAQEAGIKKIKAGIKACDVDQAAREVIDKEGLGKFFGHGLGHGVGICVHESPYLNSRNEKILKENMVITIEPAVYIPGKLGIRLESMVVIKRNKGERIDVSFDR